MKKGDFTRVIWDSLRYYDKMSVEEKEKVEFRLANHIDENLDEGLVLVISYVGQRYVSGIGRSRVVLKVYRYYKESCKWVQRVKGCSDYLVLDSVHSVSKLILSANEDIRSIRIDGMK